MDEETEVGGLEVGEGGGTEVGEGVGIEVAGVWGNRVGVGGGLMLGLKCLTRLLLGMLPIV